MLHSLPFLVKHHVSSPPHLHKHMFYNICLAPPHKSTCYSLRQEQDPPCLYVSHAYLTVKQSTRTPFYLCTPSNMYCCHEYPHSSQARHKLRQSLEKCKPSTTTGSMHLIKLPQSKPGMMKNPFSILSAGQIRCHNQEYPEPHAMRLESHWQGQRTEEWLQQQNWRRQLSERDGIFKITRGPIVQGLTLLLHFIHLRMSLVFVHRWQTPRCHFVHCHQIYFYHPFVLLFNVWVNKLRLIVSRS